MTQEEKKNLQKSIEAEIEKLHSEIATLEALLQPLKKDCSLDALAHESLKQEQNINIQRYEKAKQRIAKLKNALIKLETKEYGICQECEENISIERLKIMPESTYCVACMQELGL